MTERNVLVTGGAGFIGSYLVEKLLSNNERVRVIDNFSYGSVNYRNVSRFIGNSDFKLMVEDIRDIEKLKEAIQDVDLIYHLAAQIHVEKSYINPDETWDINATATKNLLELVRKSNTVEKVVYASSSEVFGDGITPEMNEDHPLSPKSPYGASKAAGDCLCNAYYETYGINIVIMRSFNTVGARQNFQGYGAVLPIFVDRILHDLPPVVYGKGDQTRDFMNISDAIKGYILASESDSAFGKAINFGTGVETTILELAEKCIELSGKKGKVEPAFVHSRPGEVKRLCASSKMAKDLLKFTVDFSVDDSIKQVIKHFKMFGNEEWDPNR